MFASRVVVTTSSRTEFPTFLAVLGCLPRVEAAVLRRVSLRSCRGRVRAVRCEEEMFLPTRRPQRVRSSRGGRDTRLLRPKHDPLLVYTMVLVSDFSTAVGCASGGGDGAVVEVPVASSGPPSFSVRHPRGMPLRDLFFPCLYLY
ncbi:hypothetical protein Taro_036498 [Colocasia esculenta]|uniref:Uncharacterized protein n=1 Tax=Colocasia esculenta TaxID=4460 RepID=A0A843VXP0_COLES|nr:hypothetical protein [Colocasia esculenta]